MKAVVYDGPRQVSVKDVPDARIERPRTSLPLLGRAHRSLSRGPRALFADGQTRDEGAGPWWTRPLAYAD